MLYKRLDDRLDKLWKMHDETNNVKYLMEGDCICSLLEGQSYKRYENILSFAKENNFKRVYDIGCAYGHQSEIFLNEKIEYIGVNEHNYEFWNADKFKYIVNYYPFKIETDKTDLAVSVSCLTWNCYLDDGEETLKKQCEQLQHDFKHCLLYMAKDKIDFVKKYYDNYKILNDNFVYFYND